MDWKKIAKTDRSYITRKSIKDRIDWLKKGKNSFFKSSQKIKDGFRLIFSSPYTRKKTNKYEILIDVDQNKNCKVHCSCEGFHKQGMMYRAGLLEISIFKEKRADKRWGQYHSIKTVLCKHLWILFNHQSNSLDRLIEQNYKKFMIKKPSPMKSKNKQKEKK